METFGPLDLLKLYASGVFPMAESRDSDEIYLVQPEMRGIIPLEGLKISRSLAKTVRAHKFEIRINTAFAEVVAGCAAPRPDHPETWINEQIESLYNALHQMGHAHSVECWQHGRLVGGLYGVHLRGGFFGESMFSRARDASKVALVHLVGRLRAGGFSLLDTQFMTPHLQSLGAIEIPHDGYISRLEQALQKEGDFEPQGFCDFDFAAGVRQSKTQTS